jgi:hypothetical protein
MNAIPSQNPKVPSYLTAPWPAHFRMRTDLIEELCVPEAFARTLPRTPEEHARWLTMWGQSADQVLFDSVSPYIGRPYAPTEHYLLQPAIFPGHDYIQNVLTDGRGWSVCCELGGLYDFVVARAVQFCVSRGHQRAKAQSLFYPKVERNLGPGRKLGWWAIRYECGTGLCTIVPSNKSGEENQDPAAQ